MPQCHAVPRCAAALTVILVCGCDHSGESARSANVAAQPLAVSCSVSPHTAVQGTPVQVTVTVSGGNGTLSYSYSATSGAISGAVSSATLDTSAATPGMVMITCSAKDSSGSSAASQATETVVAASANSYYVANNGSDSADGSAAHPFQTLGRAQIAMQGSNVKTATLEEGTYYLPRTLQLVAADRGETWMGLAGAHVALSGGQVLAGWSSADGHVYSTAAAHPVGVDLSIGGVRQQAADLGYDPERPFTTGWRVVDPNMPRNTGTLISVQPQDLSASVKPGATVQLLSDVRYSDNFSSIVAVDAANHTITLADPFYDGAAGGTSGHSASWRVLADPADLSVPGEFAYDKNTGTVYLMPKNPASLTADIVVAAWQSTLISIKSVSDITISGLVFSDTLASKSYYSGIFDVTSATISADAASDIKIENNAFIDAGNGIGLSNSSNNTITGNTFVSMGGSGVFMLGTSSANTVSSNTMTGLGAVNAASAGVALSTGNDNVVTGNVIDGSGRYGIILYPSNYRIANNIIRNIAQQTTDTGAIYSWAADVPGWVDSGLTIAGNRIENTGGLSRDGAGDYVPGFSVGIYMDDHVSGATMTKNVIESATSGIFLCHGCSGNAGNNNLIVMQAPGNYVRRSGGSSPATQDMDFNGTMTFDFLPSFFPNIAPRSVIVVHLSGDPAGAPAHFTVTADGQAIGSGFAPTAAGDFVFHATLSTHHHHEIGLTLDNGVDSGTSTAALHDISFFINNTAVVPQAASPAFQIAGNDDLLVSDMSITHSIMYMSAGYAAELDDFTSTGYPQYVDPNPGTIDFNLLYRNVGKASDPIFGSRPLDAHSVVADPLFEDPGSGNYTLKAGSPAVGIGFDTTAMPLAPQ